MDDLRTVLDQLEDKRLDYVMARSKVNTDAKGYTDAGIHKNTFYLWPAEERNTLNELAQRVKRETATRALMVIQDAAEEAAKVMAAGLKSRDERIKHSSATDILDRTLGKATSPVQLQGQNGDLLKVIFEHTNSQDTTTAIPSGPEGDH